MDRPRNMLVRGRNSQIHIVADIQDVSGDSFLRKGSRADLTNKDNPGAQSLFSELEHVRASVHGTHAVVALFGVYFAAARLRPDCRAIEE